MKIGIGLIPEQSVMDDLIRFQQILSEAYPVSYFHDHESIPFLNLLQGEIPDEYEFEYIIKDIKAYLHKNNSNLIAHISDISFHPPNSYHLVIAKELWIANLHSFVFKSLKDFLLPPVQKYRYYDYCSDAHRLNYLKYGNQLIGNCYQPTLKLGNFLENNRNEFLDYLKRTFFRCIFQKKMGFKKVAIFHPASDGTIDHSLAELLL